MTSEAIRTYGAREIKKHLDAMRAEVEGVRQGQDIEYIHRMRVASRRMRSTLTLFGEHLPKQKRSHIARDVRDVTQALGEARDLDVQLESLKAALPELGSARYVPGLRRLELRLEQQRKEIQGHVNHAMDELEQDDTLNRIEQWIAPFLSDTGNVFLYSPALYELAFVGINARIQALLGHVPYIHDPANITELHAMRISAKRLRYTLEAFDDLYSGKLKPFISQTKSMQDELGLVHDLDVWIALVPRFISEERDRITTYFGHDGPIKRLLPGLVAFQKSRMALRDAAYQDYIGHWDKLEAEQVWPRLLQLINTPLDLELALRALRLARENPETAPGGAESGPEEGQPED